MLITQEPKYVAIDGKIVNRASGEAIPDDEPVFVLRARDWHAVRTLNYYINSCNNPEQALAVTRRMSDFMKFAIEHPERMKEPDTELPNG